MSPWSSHPAGVIAVHTLEHRTFGGLAHMDVAVNMLGSDKLNLPTIRLWLYSPESENFDDSETEILLTTVQAQRLAYQLADYLDDLRYDDGQRPQSLLVRPTRKPAMEYQGPPLAAQTSQQLHEWALTYDPDIVEEWASNDEWMMWGLTALAALVVLTMLGTALIIEVFGR